MPATLLGNGRRMSMFDYMRTSTSRSTSRWPNQLVWAFFISIIILSLPASRFQNPLKAAFWTLVLAYAYCPYVVPHVRNTASASVFALMCVCHTAIVYFTYSTLLQAGYLYIGILVVVEILIFSIPGGWIIAHSPNHKPDRECLSD